MKQITSTSSFLKAAALSISILALSSVSAYAGQGNAVATNSVQLVHVPNVGERVQQGQAKSEALPVMKTVGEDWVDSNDFNESHVSQCFVTNKDSCLVNANGIEVPAMSLLSGTDSNVDFSVSARKNEAFYQCVQSELSFNGGNIADAKFKCFKYWED